MNTETTKSGKKKIHFPPCREDIDLINKISKFGDHEAFNRLIEIHGKTIKDILFSFGSDQELVEEVYQCVLIRIWKHLKKFRLESSFPTWYYRVTRNIFIDYKRKSSKERLVNSSQLLAFDDHTEEEMFDILISKKGDIETPSSPSDFLDREEKVRIAKEKVKFLFKNLSPKHREVLRLFELEGANCSSIAKKINCSIGTVLSRIHYARENARRIIPTYKSKAERH